MAESSTASNSATASILWTVRNFQSWLLTNEYLYTRGMRALPNIKENLSLSFLFWYSKSRKLFVRLSITNAEFEASIKLSLLDADLRQFNEKRQNHKFSKTNTYCTFEDFIKKDILLDKDNKLLPHDKLVLYCEITIDDKSQRTQRDDSDVDASAKAKLRDVLRLLLEKECIPDFVVHVKDRQFLCHKCILACRCKYFSNLFRSSASENDKGELIIDDIEPSIFKNFLHYLYTGKVDATESEAFQLLVAADKYGLKRLKILCESKIHASIDLGNAFQMFAFACAYNLEGLRLKTHLTIRDFANISLYDFLIDNPPHVQKTLNIGGSDNGYSKNVLALNLLTKCELPFRESTVSESSNDNKKTYLPKVDAWCHTELKLLKEDKWIIKNFRNQDFSSRKTLSLHNIDCDKSSWAVIVRSNVSCDGDEESTALNLYLKCTSTSKICLYSFYKFSILNTGNKETNIVRGSCQKSEKKHLEIPFCLDVKNILSSDDLLHGDDLTICCKIFFPVSSGHTDISAYSTVPECNLVNEISSLLRDESFTDIVIKIGSESFPCHKCILSCHSPFFESKFQEIKSQEVELEIEDIEPSIFKKVLSAMYSGKCELTAPEVWKLLPVENKYNFFSTTPIFDDAFILALTVENAAQAVSFVVSERSAKLQTYVLQFIDVTLDKVLQIGHVQQNVS